MQRQKIGILGATGMVGQRFIQLLEHHPWFEVAWLAASDKSSGKRYGDAVKWKLDTALPARIAEMQVSPATPAGRSAIKRLCVARLQRTDVARTRPVSNNGRQDATQKQPFV